MRTDNGKVLYAMLVFLSIDKRFLSALNEKLEGQF